MGERIKNPELRSLFEKLFLKWKDVMW